MGAMRTLRRTGPVAAVGFALLVPAAALAAVNGTFSGTTAQGKVCGSNGTSRCAIRVQVTNNHVGKKGTGEAHVLWRASCKSKGYLTGNTEFYGPLDANHNLHVHGSYIESGLGSQHGKPVTARDTVTVDVHVAGKLTGTVTDSSNVFAGSQKIDHCSTGTINFTAQKV